MGAGRGSTPAMCGMFPSGSTQAAFEGSSCVRSVSNQPHCSMMGRSFSCGRYDQTTCGYFFFNAGKYRRNRR